MYILLLLLAALTIPVHRRQRWDRISNSNRMPFAAHLVGIIRNPCVLSIHRIHFSFSSPYHPAMRKWSAMKAILEWKEIGNEDTSTTSVYLGLDFQSSQWLHCNYCRRWATFQTILLKFALSSTDTSSSIRGAHGARSSPPLNMDMFVVIFGTQICAHCPACRNNSRNGTLYHRDVIEIATAWAGLKSM